MSGDNPYCNYVLISDTVLSGDAHVWAMNVISEHVGDPWLMNVSDMLSSDASKSLIVNNDPGFTPIGLFKLQFATAIQTTKLWLK